jgi:hypothetical protein
MRHSLPKLRRKLSEDRELKRRQALYRNDDITGSLTSELHIEEGGTLLRTHTAFLGVATAGSLIASIASAQQAQPPPQQNPTAREQMMMDCQRMMMQGQGQSPSSGMMEHCRSMMGQTPAPGSSQTPQKKQE